MNNIIQSVLEHKIIAIIRGVTEDKIIPTVQALYDGGIRLAEITFSDGSDATNTQTASMIQAVSTRFDGKMFVGAGTVTDIKQVDLTYQSGGKFVISPDTYEAVIARTKELGMVSMPGALTATEVRTAVRAGADFVKLFPLSNLGEGYIKALKGPFSHINFLAVGGVNLENMKRYYQAGACGFGIGTNIVDKTMVENNAFDKIRDLVKEYVMRAKELNR